MAENISSAPDVALLVDWENIKFSLLTRDLRPNLSAILSEARTFGRLVLSRAYADFQQPEHGQDARALYGVGIEPVYVPTRTYDQGGHEGSRRKNSVDVRIATDAVESCHRYPGIAVYVLGSGDGDFLHIVNALRPYGKKIVIMAVSWSASGLLLESADQVILYDRDIEPPSGTAPNAEKYQRPQTLEPNPNLGKPSLSQMFETIRQTTTEFKGAARPLLMTQLKAELLRRVPDFREDDYGYVKFKPLVLAAERAGIVKVQTLGLLDWVFLPGEKTPLELTSLSSADQGDLEPAGVHEHSWGSLDRGMQEVLILFLEEVEATSPYMTIGHVANVGTQRRLFDWPREAFVGVVSDAIQQGIVLRDDAEILDPATGQVRRQKTLRLNRAHQDVVQVIRKIQEQRTFSPED